MRAKDCSNANVVVQTLASFRAFLLPEFHHITLMMSGVRVRRKDSLFQVWPLIRSAIFSKVSGDQERQRREARSGIV